VGRDGGYMSYFQIDVAFFVLISHELLANCVYGSLTAFTTR